VKIVFLVRHALYLRNFESTVRGLAERGHDIRLVFSPLVRQVDSTLATTLTTEYENVNELPLAPRTGWWWPASDGIRVLRDYLRYLEPEYAQAPALVERGGRRLPNAARWLFDHVPGMKSRPVASLLNRLTRTLDRAIEPDRGVVAALKDWAPDVLLVTPIVDFTYGQTEFVKAARALHIPTVLAVASWDNLTNKGLVQICPDLVLVWNAIQEREAIAMHSIPAERIRKTGAQLYDHWFEMEPSSDYASFCARVGGLDPAKPTILYLCSSSFVCKDEVSFVKEWLAALRRSSDATVREANVIVRPHPQHAEQWPGVSLAPFGNAVVWPSEAAAPLDAERKQSYFDSLYHAGVVVGINTSGFIEAGIVGKRTLTLATDHFRATQEGTLHFHYLVQGRLLEIAKTFDEHLTQLSRALENPEETEREVQDFIAGFVRPSGLDKRATPFVIEAIEQAKDAKSQGWVTPAYAPLVRAAFWPLAAPVRRQVLDVTNVGMYRDVERTKLPRYMAPERRAPKHFNKETEALTKQVYAALAKIADSNKPIVAGPWVGSVRDEILYWIPMLRWACEAYGFDPKRLVVVSRGGAELWYGDLAHRYVDAFDILDPAGAGSAWSGNGDPDLENRLLQAVQAKLGLGTCDVLPPKLMSKLFRHQGGPHNALDHLLYHARYLPLAQPDPGDLEARLPADYYAVRFGASAAFPDRDRNRQFVHDLIGRLLEKSSVVLLDGTPGIDGETEIGWREAGANGSGTNARLIRAADWMTPRNTLEVQSRVIARARCFAGSPGGLSCLAPFYGTPAIAFAASRGDVMDGHFTTAEAASRSFGVPSMLLTPEDAKLLNSVL
jgi:hypothetical protein